MGAITYLSITPGESVSYLGTDYFVKQILDLSTVLLEQPKTLKVIRAEISDLILSKDEKSNEEQRDIAGIPDEDWQEAERRFAIILPILQNRGDADIVKAVSKKKFVSVPTLYRWIKMYDSTGNKSSLAPAENHGGRGKSRIPEEIEAVIKSCIEDVYLNKQKKSIKKVCLEVNTRCRNANINPPHPNTVRSRILTLSEEIKLQFRLGKSASKEKYQPIRGSFPGADYPLSVVQIDHTKLDIIVVDKVHRKAIGRPWITLAIDVFSRTVLGYYISFDPPGALSIGMCVFNAIMPKEMLLHNLDVTGEYPCYGVMRTIHCDNGKDFRGQALLKACSEYNIQLNWRPVRQPHWGGHIERMLGTLLHELHTLPGTTFDKPHHRKYYNSEKEAALTIEELEQWLATYIVNVYHQRIHKGIGQTPLQKWKEGISGSDYQLGTGLPKKIFDGRKLMLDFLPFEERTVQDYGVVIDYVYYYHDVLRKWINALEPGTGKSKTRRKFIFKRDPRDISVIYFFDPEQKDYYNIPYRNISHPPMSIWEFNEIVRNLKERNTQNIDEEKIFTAYQKLKIIEENAVTKKQVARKNARQAKKEHSKAAFKQHNKTINNNTVVSDLVPDSLFDSKNIKPFEELDHEAFN